MIPTIQPAGLAPRVHLIEMSVVRALTGLRRDEIYDRVDGSSLLHPGLVWVWDLATGQHIRDLRFWQHEIEMVKLGTSCAEFKLAQVIDKILPRSRNHFHSGEVIQMFALSRPTLQALRDELNGDLHGARNVMFSRANLVKFLEARWIGASSRIKMEVGR